MALAGALVLPPAPRRLPSPMVTSHCSSSQRFPSESCAQPRPPAAWHRAAWGRDRLLDELVIHGRASTRGLL